MRFEYSFHKVRGTQTQAGWKPSALDSKVSGFPGRKQKERRKICKSKAPRIKGSRGRKYFLLHGKPSRQGAVKPISFCASLALAYLPVELIKHFTKVQQHDLPQIQTQLNEDI